MGLHFQSQDRLTLHDSGKAYTTTLPKFVDLVLQAIDSKTVVFFKLADCSSPAIALHASLAQILDIGSAGPGLWDFDAMDYMEDFQALSGIVIHSDLLATPLWPHV